MTGIEVVASLVSLTALASYINSKFIKLPKSIGVTLVSLILSLFITISGKFGLDINETAKNLISSVSFDETFLGGMLSFLLFAGALHINGLELSRYKYIVLSLATVSVIVSTILVAYAMYGISYFLGMKIPLSYCFVFGALISPTDPIAVLGILKNLCAPKSLEIKIAGEALFNDGMGIVLFLMALNFATGQEQHFTVWNILICFLKQGVGGLIVGAAIGMFTSYLLKNIDDYDVGVILTLAVATGGYTLAHSVLHVSGPISMVVAGLLIGGFMGKGAMTKQTVDRIESFWELMDGILSAILFVLIGLEFVRISFNLQNSLAAVGAIVITLVARWISVALPVFSLNQFKRFDKDILAIMTWGGLRGGISIALALSIQGEYHNFMISVTYAVVLFSIMVQGLTISGLVQSKIDSGKIVEKSSYSVSCLSTTNNNPIQSQG